LPSNRSALLCFMIPPAAAGYCISGAPVPISNEAPSVLGTTTTTKVSSTSTVKPALSAGQRIKPVGQLVELPLSGKACCLRPGRLLIAQRWQRRGFVHGGYRAIEAQAVSLRREPPGRQNLLQRPYLRSRLAAPTAPTPLAPGIRSEASPRKAIKSGPCQGSTP
jgi:hypothetical protein